MNDWYWGRGIRGHDPRLSLNPRHIIWCLSIFVAILLAATSFFIVQNKRGRADIAELCAEAHKLPGFKGIDASGRALCVDGRPGADREGVKPAQ